MEGTMAAPLCHPAIAPQHIPEAILAILAMVGILATLAALMVDMHPPTVPPPTLLVTMLLPTVLPHTLEATALLPPRTQLQHTLLQPRTQHQPPLMLLQPLVTLAMVTAVDLLQLSTPPMGLWTEGILAAQLSMPRPLATPDMVQDMPLPPLIPLATVVLLVMLLPHTLEQGMELQASMLQLLAMLPQCQHTYTGAGYGAAGIDATAAGYAATVPATYEPTPEQGMELQDAGYGAASFAPTAATTYAAGGVPAYGAVPGMTGMYPADVEGAALAAVPTEAAAVPAAAAAPAPAPATP
uniref:Uncharacterized protein n=1 Tax=Eutreptiella gymnastica TaxID=73025 RepID=A0A6T2HDH8_9EUGL